MIDAMIITYNEELNLPHCLASLQGWTRKIFVVDSGSTDRTVSIAKDAGAHVVHHDWEGYARQKNWGLDNLPFEADWILIVDADEVITPEVRDRLTDIASKPVESVQENGFFINRLTFFMGRPIRHCGYYPSWNLRFFKRGKGRYEDREVHEHIVIDDPVGYLREHMLHDDRRGLEHYVAKHNRYSTLEARAIYSEISEGRPPEPAANVAGDTRRRRWLKRHVLQHLPMPWLWRFAYMYFLRFGFLDGRVGFDFCRFIAVYDYLVAAKLRAMKIEGRTAREQSSSATSGLALPEGADPARRDSRASLKINGHDDGAGGGGRSQGDVEPAVAEECLDTAEDLKSQIDRRMPPGFPAEGSVPVSVLIPVKNEQRNIVDCIRHVLWANEIVVVDSQSTDDTIALSQAMGADVYQFHYSKEGWPKKKNWALENVPWKNEWVLILDADEHMTPELAEEVRQVVCGEYKPPNPQKAGCGDGYWLNRRFMFMGRWIKGCGYYPSWNIRLLKHRYGRYERIGDLGDTGSGDNEVHEHIILDRGEAGYLQHDFLHYAFPDLTTWIEKHNRYTLWEAHAMKAGDKGEVRASIFGGPIARRRWMKQVARRMPFTPMLRFIYSYIIQRGFLDGYPGFVMCRLLAWYEFVSAAKYHEMLRVKDDGVNRK